MPVAALALFLLLAPSDLGEALYSRHCAVCHGEEGRAQGSIPRRLRPRPRDFGSGAFRMVRTENGVPTDADLAGVIRRGMPGSAMPSFGWMSDGEVEALVRHVRRLAVDGLAETVAREAEWWEGRVMTPEEARAEAEERLTPGNPVDVTVPADPDGALRARGARLYAVKCQACHGPDGSGLAVRPRWSDGRPVYARDFTAGVMKGGAELPDLIRRIRAGLPGSGMPPTTFDRSEDAAAVALHVRGLLRPGAEDRLVQTRRTIPARRVERFAGDASDWSGNEVSLVLAPMVWSDRAIVEAAVEAIHDGERVAIRIRWEDESRDDDALRGARLPDATALQWSSDAADPLVGMGAANRPHDVWRWQAFRPEDVPGWLDLVQAGGASGHGLPPSAEALRADGAEGEAVLEETGRSLDTTAAWRDGVWSVVLRRPLDVREEGAIALAPGGRVAVALAIWNGAAGDQGLRKSITIWHELTLDD
ncbi:MAG: ethylbenzene dehydrogenase-related protein [Planctomycetota bacterium JB042]